MLIVSGPVLQSQETSKEAEKCFAIFNGLMNREALIDWKRVNKKHVLKESQLGHLGASLLVLPFSVLVFR